MAKILVVYGTTDGHTAKIADAFAQAVERQGWSVDVVNAADAGPAHGPENYDATVVAASVHAGRYQHSALHWVRRNATTLARQPNALVSVCLGVLEDNAVTRSELDRILNRFVEKAGWRPTTTRVFAGAIPYTRYGFFKRWVMKRIAAKRDGATDTSRDYEYTDWPAVEAFAREFVGKIQPERLRA